MAKTVTTLLLNRLERLRAGMDRGEFSRDDIYFVIDEIIKIARKNYPKRVNKVEILEGWKSSDKIDIRKDFKNDFIIVSHLKDKETGEVKEVEKTIPVENVNKMLNIIRNLPQQETYKCYYISKKLGWKSWKDLWRERKLYFSTYYFPIKILEALKIISYSGRGDITRIK